MAILLSSADAPKAQVARDPGVRAEPAAFQSPLGIAAEELKPAAEAFHQEAVDRDARLAKAQADSDNRKNTVDRAGRAKSHTQYSEMRLRDLSANSDITNEQVLMDYGKDLADNRNKLIQEHGGTDESRALLTARLIGIESQAIGQAGALSAKIGREIVANDYKDSVEPLVQAASLDPTIQNVDQQLLHADTYMDDLSGADPSQEATLRAGAKEQIALGALDTLIQSGRSELASSMLENRLFTELSLESQRAVRLRINGVRAAKDEFDREINAIESRLGRPLSEQELLSKVGISSATQKLTEKDKRIQHLIGRGYTPDFANDVASGSIEIKGPDQYGQYTRVNSVTNESTPVTGEDAERITQEMEQAPPAQEEQAPEAQQPAKQERLSLEGAVEEGTGPFAAIRTGISNVIGPFMEGEVFKETASAKQKVRTFNQFAKTALVNNPRFPVAEQKIVQQLLPDVEAVFLDPDRARTALDELKDSLNEMHDAKAKELGKEGITLKRRAELSDQMSRVNEILTLMTEEEPESLPEGVPEGSEPAGQSKRGNPVFRSPDGKLFEVAP